MSSQSQKGGPVSRPEILQLGHPVLSRDLGGCSAVRCVATVPVAVELEINDEVALKV